MDDGFRNLFELDLLVLRQMVEGSVHAATKLKHTGMKKTADDFSSFVCLSLTHASVVGQKTQQRQTHRKINAGTKKTSGKEKPKLIHSRYMHRVFKSCP